MNSPQLKNYFHLLLQNSTETVTVVLLLRLAEHFFLLQSAQSLGQEMRFSASSQSCFLNG